ncbi:zinc finger CCCH domain-containing protein [Trifolium repens]|nr:zinc finger CCCH domain-containing protein [Trifolium repens]
MRERERVERESDRRGRSRALSPKHKHHGYIHRVDQAAISFFVTNFPTEVASEELWEIFARFGRVGDVYIPNKVDKWGRRFGFVKFLEVRDEESLNRRLQEVWFNTFKLRVNRSRFHRNEERRKEDNHLQQPNQVKLVTRREGEGSIQQGRSFRTALLEAKGGSSEMVEAEGGEEDVLQVEVDERILQDLKMSFVGVLALQVDVRKIRTTLYMEGLPHIVVTDMGRNNVLLFSPRKGELENLCKAKADWLCYYFKEFRPWLPSLYVDRRETWVRVLGIPLHAWGENLFKEIGRKYGEFLDFDESTASRAKLDVARLKIATSLRGFIDDAVQIKVLGVYYTIWVVEDKVSQPVFVQGSGMEDQECSWVDSLKFPAEARVVCGGDSGVMSEEEVEEERVDFPDSHSGKHGEEGNGEGDNSLVEVSSDQ